MHNGSRKDPATNTIPIRERAWKVHGNHVYPVNDLREHSATNCWCGPVEDDGIMVHHSLDGRELYETGERKLS